MSQETINKAEITVTKKAVNQILNLMKENDVPSGHGLRVKVLGGGCSGLTYKMGFDGEINSGDSIYQIDGAKIIIDGKSLFYLTGTELDFSDGLNGRGFTFNNPNAKKTCGCGESFGV